MKEYTVKRDNKDYLLKRYSISREGYLMKDSHGEVYRIRPKKEGGIIISSMVWQI